MSIFRHILGAASGNYHFIDAEAESSRLKLVLKKKKKDHNVLLSETHVVSLSGAQTLRHPKGKTNLDETFEVRVVCKLWNSILVGSHYKITVSKNVNASTSNNFFFFGYVRFDLAFHAFHA